MDDTEFTLANYKKYISSRKLMAAKCGNCSDIFLPPRPVCSQCHSRDMVWLELSGKGTVIGFTSITIVPTPMAAKGYGRDNPYLTAVVQTEEGPGITALLDGIDASDPASTSVGMAVVADFKEEAQGEESAVSLVFRPA